MMIATALTTPLVEDVARLVDGVPGWSPVDQLYTLATLVYASADVPGDVVEVGAWCGRSTVVLARAVEETGRGAVHAVDLFPSRGDWHQNSAGAFSFSLSIDGDTIHGNAEHPVWAEVFRDQLEPIYAACDSTFEIFTQTIRDRAVEQRVSVHRGTAQTFARQVGPDFQCRLAFVDGDHGYEAVKKDIRALTPLLSPGAWICFDDAFSTYAGVNRALEEEVIGNPLFTGGRQLTRKLFVARRTETPL